MTLITHTNKTFMAKFERYEPLMQDHSSTIVFKTCDRKYFYRIVLGFVPRVEKFQTVFDFGSAYHKFREVLELTSDLSKAIVEASKIKIAESSFKKFSYLNRTVLLKAIYEAHQDWEKEKERKNIEVLSVEQPINVQLSDGSYTAGRTDQVNKWSGDIWVRDFKTTSKDEQSFAASKDPDDQATRYIFMLSKLHGKLIGGIMYDVLHHSFTEKNGVKFHLYKHIQSRTQRQLDQWEKEQIHINKQIQLDRELDIWPMKEHNCSWCPYNWVCRQPNEAAQMAKLETDYVKKPWDMHSVEQVAID